MTENEWLEYFSEELNRRIDESGYSRAEIADMANITESSMSRYVRGLQMPKATVILNLTLALECDIADLTDFGEKIIFKPEDRRGS